jgi:hypothetical protein
MKYLTILFFLVSGLVAGAENEFMVSLPSSYLKMQHGQELCRDNSKLRICRESGKNVVETEFICNINKYDCTKSENLFTLSQFVADERDLNVDCIKSLARHDRYSVGVRTVYVTYEIHQNCE